MKKQIFKEGDKVFHYGFGWGKIDFIDDETEDYPIVVMFKSGSEQTFTLDGKFELTDINPTLSFTEYTLQGFSQEKPIILPKVGELCLVRDTDNEDWTLRMFRNYHKCFFYTQETDDYFSRGYKQLKRIKILD